MYTVGIHLQLYENGFEAEADLDDSDTLNKKVRNAQLAQYNFILVVGEKEQANGTVNVRTRDNKVEKYADLRNKYRILQIVAHL